MGNRNGTAFPIMVFIAIILLSRNVYFFLKPSILPFPAKSAILLQNYGLIHMPVLSFTRARIIVQQSVTPTTLGFLVDFQMKDFSLEPGMANASFASLVGMPLLSWSLFQRDFTVLLTYRIAEMATRVINGQQLPIAEAAEFLMAGYIILTDSSNFTKGVPPLPYFSNQVLDTAITGTRKLFDCVANTSTLFSPLAYDRFNFLGASQKNLLWLALAQNATGSEIFYSVFSPSLRKSEMPHVVVVFNVTINTRGFLFLGKKLVHINGTFDRMRPRSCKQHAELLDEELPRTFVDEVIVLTQLWGFAVYHMYEENLARLLVLIDYALRFTHVKIHLISSLSRFELQTLALFGIDESRIVSGPINARIAIVPDGITCGGTPLWYHLVFRERLWASLRLPRNSLGMAISLPMQNYSAGENNAAIKWPLTCSAALNYRRSSYARAVSQCAGYLFKYDFADVNMTSESCKKPTVVLIRRKAQRSIKNFDILVAEIRFILPVAVEVFDEGIPQETALRMFSNADVIIGPHGAGFVNLVAVRPGTTLIEILPERGLNTLYMQVAIHLGMDYRCFMPSNSTNQGQFVVDVRRIIGAVRHALWPGQVPENDAMHFVV